MFPQSGALLMILATLAAHFIAAVATTSADCTAGAGNTCVVDGGSAKELLEDKALLQVPRRKGGAAKPAVRRQQSVTYTAASVQLPQGYNESTVKAFVERASSAGADIVVFPEVGPGSTCLPPRCNTWPAPDAEVSLCGKAGIAPLIDELACTARDSQVYLAVNTVDAQPCTRATTSLCPSMGTFRFNAEVVFNREGALVAKYYKRAIFTEYWKVSQPTPALLLYYNTSGVFDTDFGVRFGIAICNDLNNNALMRSYKELGITDMIVSDAWDDSNSQQTMATMLTGLSYTYNLNIVAASASQHAGGSGQYSAGRVLNNSFRPGCISPGKVGGISEVECDDFVTSAVASPPALPQGSRSGGKSRRWVPFPQQGLAKYWPTIWQRRPCLGVVIPDLILLSKVAGTKLGPASSYGRITQGAIVQRYYGNNGDCTLLEAPKEPGEYFYQAVAISTRITCSVRAVVTQPGTRGETYVLRAISTRLYMPMTPCPLAGSICTLSRCVNYGDDNSTCISWVDAQDDQEGFTQFSSISLFASFPHGTISYPMMANGHLRSVPTTSLQLRGPWSPYILGRQHAWGMQNIEVVAEEEALSDGFGFLTAYGSLKVTWPDYCNECGSPYEFGGFQSAHLLRPPMFSPFYALWGVFCGLQNPIYGSCGLPGQPPCFVSLPEGKLLM